jgi:hypothetical protein
MNIRVNIRVGLTVTSIPAQRVPGHPCRKHQSNLIAEREAPRFAHWCHISCRTTVSTRYLIWPPPHHSVRLQRPIVSFILRMVPQACLRLSSGCRRRLLYLSSNHLPQPVGIIYAIDARNAHVSPENTAECTFITRECFYLDNVMSPVKPGGILF